jgi:hypothetical protein
VAVGGDLTLQIKELSDDDGSHNIQRPGVFERSDAFTIVRAV